MKQLLRPRAIFIIAFVLLSSFAIGTWAKTKHNRGVLRDLETFAKVVERIQTYYVDEIDTHELVTEAIERMLRELDPHSQFLSGLDYEDLMVSTQGQFGGLGIFISIRDDYPTVISPIDGTPASRAGLQSGDQIVEIEGNSAKGWPSERAVNHLRGAPGSHVRFKVSRPGLNDTIEYDLVRERIAVKSVSYYSEVDGYGYVKISNFSKNTRDELTTALDELEAQGIKGLVLDLRSNPGGLLQAATQVSELFLEKDKLVVYTKGRFQQNNQKYYARRTGKHTEYPIVVMVNGASASASEIVAGALQDWDAGFVVGQTSFGKGTVQTVFSLSDSQAVKLTTARYYTPSGRSIHMDPERRKALAKAEAGDDEDADEPASDLAMGERTNDELGDPPIFHTSGGRIVYGGGGITPDLEFEPQKFGDLERRLERDALFFSFAVKYTQSNEVPRDLTVDAKLLGKFKDFLESKDFEYKPEEFEGNSLEYVKKAIIREMISKQYGRKAMYRAMLNYDPEFQRVLAIFGELPSLQAMYKYAEEQKSLKKASLE